MTLYGAIRPLLFALDAETAHQLTLGSLKTLHGLGLFRAAPGAPAACGRDVMGLRFSNPVGLAAGLDKNGDFIDALAALGFGFIEIGTITPRPQPGNPRPRLFRLPEAQAVVNRLGFNNHGVDRLVENVRRARYRGVLGINIGKNADTPIERAADDYLACLRKVYPVASYVTVNISSPNTQRLRELQQADELERLLAALKREQRALAQAHGRHVPLAVKIAPDLEPRGDPRRSRHPAASRDRGRDRHEYHALAGRRGGSAARRGIRRPERDAACRARNDRGAGARPLAGGCVARDRRRRHHERGRRAREARGRRPARSALYRTGVPRAGARPGMRRRIVRAGSFVP